MADGANGQGDVAALGELLDRSKRIVVLSGAGISTESGIPDFRSPGGIWSRMQPITFGEFISSEEARMEDWRRRLVMNASFAAAEPNAGHHALVRLAGTERFLGLITQNIDGLHQRAGFPVTGIVEIHGNSTHGQCLDCGTHMDLETARALIEATGASPRCRCGGLVKAAVISFGQPLAPGTLARAGDWAARADLFLVLGSSLKVRPAASLPVVAKQNGARLAIVNREPTDLDPLADLVIALPIGNVFTQLFPTLAKRSGSGRE